jgi:YfiH family protein
VQLARCLALEDVPRIAHAFSTVRGPEGSNFDLGGYDSVERSVVDRRRMFMSAAGMPDRQPTILQQVHGAELIDVVSMDGSGAAPEADGAIAVERDGTVWSPAVRTADCIPLLLAAVDGSAVAAVHAGWRGTAGGIVRRALASMRELDVVASRLVAAVGPAIRGCCYQVGDEVAEAVAHAAGADVERLARRHAGGRRLDLGLAVRLQLSRAGLEDRAIHVAPWCTVCSNGLFFSYRRESSGAGRQMACIGWPAHGPP